MTVRFSILSGLFASLGLTACQTSMPVPAVITDNTPETRAAVSSTLGAAVGRARVEITPASLEGAGTVSVLPPPLTPNETASIAVPTHFAVMMDGETCLAVHKETGETFALAGVACRAAGY